MSKIITRAEVAKHDSENDCWIIVHSKVYNVTKFLDEHPGGGEVIQDLAGQDSSTAFEDVGHSQDARDMLKDYEVGILPENERETPKAAKGSVSSVSGGQSSAATPIMILAALVIGFAVVYKMMA